MFQSQESPKWRRPQLGALGALIAHWSLPRCTPALVSLPTGTGKTAIAVAAPHLINANRVLVVVPSTELRRQMVAAFRSEEVIRNIGVINNSIAPTVIEVKGRIDDWESLEQADVVVALPESISPAHYEHEPPPCDLFDVVIIDEAHHAPARTWRAIIEYFENAKSILLTATPQRNDGQRLPGQHVYHYPLRQAIEDGIFKAIQPVLLNKPEVCSHEAIDELIIERVVSLYNDPDHRTSTLLIRAANRERARRLALLYESHGIPVQLLHSGQGQDTQKLIVAGLRNGTYRAVSVVGMLIEGFDLPSLRLVAYHDKHKSLPATAQLIGRLSRVDEDFPQPSILITVRDVDVYPELQGVIRRLYEEDNDWSVILPGIIDEEIARDIANREYARQFANPPPDLIIEAINPIRRAIIYEASTTTSWQNSLIDGHLPDELQPGQRLHGQTIFYSSLNGSSNSLMLVTSKVNRPRWHNDPGLDNQIYSLHILSYRKSSQTGLPDLFFFNTGEATFINEMLRILGLSELVRPADPTRLQEAFDTLDRVSVSSVGVRNIYGGSRGIPSYRMYAGSSVERGLRDADTSCSSLGHAMIQVSAQEGTYTAGVAVGKSKYWETRYSSLCDYDEFITSLAEKYWFPPVSIRGQLLPQVSRGRRIEAWPNVKIVAIELDYALIGADWRLDEVGPLESINLQANSASPSLIDETGYLSFEATIEGPEGQEVFWRGRQDLSGNISAIEDEITVKCGFSSSYTLSELLTSKPPTFFFLNGKTVRGALIFDGPEHHNRIPPINFEPIEWQGVNIQAETRRTAANRALGCSIQEKLEDYLKNRPPIGSHRWILLNDGAGEIADYIVIEIDAKRNIYVELWHAKATDGTNPGIRITDLQVVIAQAIKSRRWITDRRLWDELGARLTGRTAPVLTIIEGKEMSLKVICGEAHRWERLSFRRTTPIVIGIIAIVQPGLSLNCLKEQMNSSMPNLSAIQSNELLTVFHDSVSLITRNVTVVCST